MPSRKNSLIQSALKLAQLYARLRDCDGRSGGTTCISCGKWYRFEQLQGGHFIPQGRSKSVMFDERNINAQCVHCNHYLSGNGRHYYHAMVRKYGQEVVDELESKEYDVRKWSLDELEGVKRYYRDKIKEYS